MRCFLYRCPATGLTVQGIARAGQDNERYVAHECAACGRVHIVNPQTGKHMSEELAHRPSSPESRG